MHVRIYSKVKEGEDQRVLLVSIEQLVLIYNEGAENDPYKSEFPKYSAGVSGLMVEISEEEYRRLEKLISSFSGIS